MSFKLTDEQLYEMVGNEEGSYKGIQEGITEERKEGIIEKR